MRDSARPFASDSRSGEEKSWYTLRRWWRENVRLSVPSADCRDHYGESISAMSYIVGSKEGLVFAAVLFIGDPYAQARPCRTTTSDESPDAIVRRHPSSHTANATPTANERTFLGYLRTSVALSMLGVVVAQLYRLQHTATPDPVFGYFALSKPLSAILQCSALGVVLLGGIRFWRQQSAMTRGKVHACGFEILTIMIFVALVGLSFVINEDVNG